MNNTKLCLILASYAAYASADHHHTKMKLLPGLNKEVVVPPLPGVAQNGYK